MAGDAKGSESGEVDAEAGNADLWAIIAFVVCIALGLGALGWHYLTLNTPANLCANAEAHCGENSNGITQ